jgi:hypothetical protein
MIGNKLLTLPTIGWTAAAVLCLSILSGCGERREDSVQVLIFVQTDCPISNRLLPEVNAIARDYADQRVDVTLVYPDPSESAEDIAAHVHDYQLVPRTVRDSDHAWVNRYRARVTPEAVVVGTDGRVRYQGRINDQFVGYTQGRREPRRHDLRLALDAVLSNQDPEVAQTEAVGCLIADLK